MPGPAPSQASQPFPSPAGGDGWQQISGSCLDGCKINLFTGDAVHQANLFSVPTVGLPLKFMLTYNSQDVPQVTEPVGVLWRHNYMARLLFTLPTMVTFVAEAGQHFDFIPNGSGGWMLNTPTNNPSTPTANFQNVTLTNPSGTLWEVLFLPSGTIYQFQETPLAGYPDSAGRLIAMTDANENTTILNYTSGLVSSIVEPEGRLISLAYTGSNLTSVTDPNSNTYYLGFDLVNNNLLQIIGPEGCTVTYAYAIPSNNLITSMTDGRGNTWTYGYNDSAQLTSVTDPESPPNTLLYGYDTVFDPTGATLARTTLDDASGKLWYYHFDLCGCLWRLIDPLNHQWRAYYDSNQMRLFESDAFPPAGPTDSINNRFRRYHYDALGNLLVYADATGRLDQMTYDANSRMLSSFVGQGSLGIQGNNWTAAYGAQGYLLCAFEDATADLQQLPSYVSAVVNGDLTSSFLYSRFNNNADPENAYWQLTDPRALQGAYPDRVTFKKGLGFWQPTGPSTHFAFQVQLSEDQSFNLSLYTSSADTPPNGLVYAEQFGRDVTLQVNDLDAIGNPRQRSFRITNNAGGAWITFPCNANPTAPVLVTVLPSGLSNDPVISALAFDVFDDRQMNYAYDAYGNLVEASGPLGTDTQNTYNSDGTLAQTVQAVTSMLSRTTQFFYLDAYKNLTKIIDATGADTLMQYDLNGNMTQLTDPNGHVWQYQYDGRNRVVLVTDPLLHTTQMQYDPNGNLSELIDALGRTWQFFYTPSNRLSKIIDPLSQQVLFTYLGPGNLASTTDARGNVYTFNYDNAHRLTQVNQPDTQMLQFALDAMNRIAAVSPPDANQTNLSAIRTTGTANWALNPGAEVANNYAPLQALFWTNSIGANNRDNSESQSGEWSLPFNFTSDSPQGWNQINLPLAPGGRFMGQVWALKALDGVSADFIYALLTRALDASLVEQQGATLTLNGTNPNWTQTAPFVFDIPGDSQFSPSQGPLQVVQMYSSPDAPTQAWVDDVTALSLSTAYQWDFEDRLAVVQTPDGNQMRMLRDRFGRVIAWADPLNRFTAVFYDSLGRVIQVQDADGNNVFYAYNEVGDLVSFTDADDNVTQYQYDNLSRLILITYPDTTTEQFAYFPNGNLQTYIDNEGRVRTFSYDSADRLLQVTYMVDSTTVNFTYDAVGNVLTREERNGDLTTFVYDSLNRVTQETRTGSVAWAHNNVYDPNSNRTALLVPSPSLYGSAIYGTNLYGGYNPIWSVPGGYDTMDRLPEFQDAPGNQTNFLYDANGWRTEIGYPNGVTTQASFDVVGRLLELATAQGMTGLLNLVYGYDGASQRTSQCNGSDSWEYGMDRAGRLVTEALNRLVDQTADNLRCGTFTGLQLDETAATVGLLNFSDGFSGNLLSADRWRTVNNPGLYMGMEMRQSNGLFMTFPRGYNNQQTDEPSVYDPFGLQLYQTLGYLENRIPLSGDLDINIMFADLQAQAEASQYSQFFLFVSATPVEGIVPLTSNTSYVFLARGETEGNQTYAFQVVNEGVSDYVFYQPGTETDGGLRIQIVGGVVTVYYWSGGVWVTNANLTYTGFSYPTLYASIAYSANTGSGTARIESFGNTDPIPDYLTSGNFVSSVFDAGRDVASWGNISWTETLPAGSDVQFQVAVSNSPSGPWSFVGPDGTGATYFTDSAGQALPPLSGRYFQYQAFLTGDGISSSTFGNVQISFTGANPSSLTTYVYDDAGNRTSKVQNDDTGVILTETTTVNDLNQVVQRVVTTSSGTVTWEYLYNGDGTLASKTNGSVTTTYTFNDQQQLVQIVDTTGLNVVNTYDTLGRWLTRTDSSGTRTFEWDGMDCIGETGPEGTTRYFIPQGQIHSFSRGGVVYQLHADALGSVRMITDPTGAVVARFDSDAWGNPLATNFDSVPSGFNYGFVGSLGVRQDSALGLLYMRARWVDPQLGRFLSRDILEISNRQTYGNNAPNIYTDPWGLQPVVDPKLSSYFNVDFQNDVLNRLRSLKPPTKCSGKNGYPDLSQLELQQVLDQIKSYLNDPQTRIALSEPAGNSAGDVYGGHVPGSTRYTVYTTVSNLIQGHQDLTTADVLEDVVLHELLHMYIDQVLLGHAKGPRPDPKKEAYEVNPQESTACHRFLNMILDCLLPRTAGLVKQNVVPEKVKGAPNDHVGCRCP